MSLEISENSLPEGWKIAPLDEVSDINMGQSPPSSTYNIEGKGLPFFQGKAEFGSFYPEAKKWCSAPSKIAQKDDILISVRAPVGPTNLAPAECCIGRGLSAIKPLGGMPYRYLLYFLRSIESDIDSLGTGTTFKAISGKILRSIKVPIAPPEQQKRIVAEIEKQFSRLDEAVANLKRVKANLKRYKAAVLKAAVEGKLTEEWRKQHPDVEPADKLLERISNEREDRFQRYLLEWQDAVANWEASGKEGKKPAKPRKSKVLSALGKSELSDLPLLPNGWAWTRLGNLNVDVFDGPFGSNLKSSDYVDDGVRVIRLENIGSLEFVDEKVSFVTEEKFAQLKKHIVGAGDLIFSSFVADGTRVVMLPSHIETAINKADCFCVRTFGETVNGRYLETFLATRTAYEQLVAQVHGATRPRINTTQLKDCPVSLPPEAEQSAIVMEIQARLSVVERIESTIDLEFVRSEQLRQSILKKAFTGRLVPQNFSEQDFL